jgi:hypothetical protein
MFGCGREGRECVRKPIDEVFDEHITCLIKIFNLEKDVRDGKENRACLGCGRPLLTTEEVGERALLIRDQNKIRTACRNAEKELEKLLGGEANPVVKIAHASADKG